MPTLADLPIEVITLIAILLKDLRNLRLVCKALYSKSFSQFLDHYFKNRCHMLERFSLNNLLEISSHSVFGPAIHSLEISTDHLTVDPPRRQPGTWISPGREFAEEDPDCVVDIDAYQRRLDDQTYIGGCGLDAAYLTRVLINLRNCKTVLINDTTRPWGAASQKRHTGVSPTSDIRQYESIDFVKRAIRVILAAIIASQITLDRFEISPGYNREALKPSMLPRRSELCFTLDVPSLIRITSLTLMLDADGTETSDVWARDLLNFLELFPFVEEFSLFFPDGDGDRDGRLSALSVDLRLSSVRLISIENARCFKEDLIQVFVNHQNTLKEIHLTNIELIGGESSWPSLRNFIVEQLQVDEYLRLDGLDRVDHFSRDKMIV